MGDEDATALMAAGTELDRRGGETATRILGARKAKYHLAKIE